MRVAAGFVGSCLLLLACTTQAPTPSPTSPGTTPSPSATPTEQPTAQPTPTVGPTTDTGLPTSILGLPVYTVAGINQLAASGALDGRYAAVAGYWAQYALPCPYMPHQPPLSGFCYGGKFGDTPESVQGAGGIDGGAPLAVMETVGGNRLWQFSAPMGGTAARVALIVHSADARSWQCEPARRADCASRLVIDRVAWADDEEVVMDQPDPNTAPADLHLTLDQVIAAAVQPGQTLVLAYPLKATRMNDVDPRFAALAQGLAWYVRVISGPADPDGIVPGVDVLVDDSNGTVISTLPLEVDAAYHPARVVLDSNGWEGPVGTAAFTISKGTTVVMAGDLGAQLAPLNLEAGDYTVHAFIDTPQANPVAGPTCDLEMSVAAGDDVAFYADFAGSGDCSWKAGSLFP